MAKSDTFISPVAPVDDTNGDLQALPNEGEFWRPPVRFGSIPVEQEPLGWDRRRGYRKLFPQVLLPFQVIERVSFGHPTLEENRLFWGDNLHVMRQLPNESVDLVYLDPPFFSGRQYNVIFGDKNELRSFTDIWEGGMPGYLIWLNARLYEMKRLLTRTGSIYIHCDWHASHYIKVEMDKLFGHERFINEIVWCYSQGGKSKKQFAKKHDILLLYSKSDSFYFNADAIRMPLTPHKQDKSGKNYGGRMGIDEAGRPYTEKWGTGRKKLYRYYLDEGKVPEDWWTDINSIQSDADERIGYPTQKPERLLERLINASCPKDGTVADFFCGGGTTAAVAQRLERRWIACDQSRVATAITEDRVTRVVEEQIGKLFPVPDLTVENWGVYEADGLSRMPAEQFRSFVLRAFGAVPDDSTSGVHGTKGAIPVWVGQPKQKAPVTASDVESFANSIRKTVRYQQDNLRDGIMLSWGFRRDAVDAAERLRRLEQTDIDFVRLDQVRIDSAGFREHIAALSTEHADYSNFLTFIHPPRVELSWKRLSSCKYAFDLSETAVLNPGARIINVQWDFDYDQRFQSTPGYSFVRGQKSEPALTITYRFERRGAFAVACKVQDDLGGEGLRMAELDVK